MTLLITGLALWVAAHWFKRILPGLRGRMGNAGKGVMALLIVGSIVLMVIGYRAAPVDFVYDSPVWFRHINNTLMLFAVILSGMGKSDGRSAGWLRHPMLWSVVVWAVAHLLVNGDVASLVLFGGMGVWALASMLLINLQDGPWQRPVNGVWAADIKLVMVSVVFYGVIAGIHHFIGPSPFGL